MIFWAISKINDLRAVGYYGINAVTYPFLKGRSELSLILQHLVQTLDPKETEFVTPTRRMEIMVTAELYRLAALIYLYRVCPSFDDEESIAALMDQAFHSFDQLPVATSPWPVFVIACESKTDAHRIRMLRIMDAMSSTRKIGNLSTMRAAIESYWKQSDLQVDAATEKPTAWWLMFNDTDKPVPWFV